MKIAEKLKQLQTEKGVTIYAISKGSKVPILIINRVLRGENVTIKSLEKIANYFKVPLIYFFDE